jgi:NADH-quinone oxidoreductase subunit I
MATKVKTVPRPQSLAQSAFLPAVIKGLGVTMNHFFKNLLFRKYTATIQYPEEKAPYPQRNRGLHRLMVRDDGQVRCVACMMCPTACPAHCITIVAEEAPDGSIEKRPRIFEIDELRCVVCGLCVEACPCDAIRMDTGQHAPPVASRAESVLGKVDLLKLAAPSIARQGVKSPEWREQAPADRSIARPEERTATAPTAPRTPAGTSDPHGHGSH